jgi:cytochrome c oxidase subunit 1
MAITEDRPLALPSGAIARPDNEQPALGVFERPRTSHGWRSWVSTVDHKKIGIMYGAVALFFLFVGGIEALMIRVQLATPNGTFLSADVYNQVFTMHAITMIFMFIMPMAAAFANYLLPLQIGARDVAFPRLNALSLWVFVAGGLFMNSSWLLGGGADCGWFCYAPNSGVTFSPTHGVDFFAIGLLIAGTASLVSSINLTVTVLNMRAPGMTLMRMPVFTWMILVVQVLLVFALPVITVALVLLSADRLFGANFFDTAEGADPLLWEHLFWIFGHPEVYIIILPAFGVISEIIPVFSRKPIFGYKFMVFAGVAIGFMGWGVWAHHMFASGIGPLSVAAFSVSTMFIAVPTGIKVFNWVGTMSGGKLKFETPMLFAVATVAMFTIGGLSGVTHSIAPADTQQTDTYYIVAHFHYVIFGGGVLGLFAGLYFWWPKVFGFRLSEGLGKVNFWMMLVGFNMTFAPMHILGLQGMSRRYYTYDPDIGFDEWNLVVSIGAFILGIGTFLFVINIFRSTRQFRAGKIPPAGPDPWDARSLEWMIQSPPPEYNFDPVPEIHGLDEFWHRKYQGDDHHKLERIAATEDVVQKGDSVGVHLPAPSYWPVVMAVGFPILGYGVVYRTFPLFALGGLIIVLAIFGWVFEPADDPNAGHGHHDDDHGDGDDHDGGGDGDGAHADADSEPEPAMIGAGDGADALPTRATTEEVASDG